LTEPSVVLPPLERQLSLLLLVAPPNPVHSVAPEFGAAGTVIASKSKQVIAAIGSPQAIDAAFGNSDVDKAVLLANFLDFTEPEAVIVDLGDEPPANIAADVANASAVEKSNVGDKLPSHSTTEAAMPEPAANSTGTSVTALKPSLDGSDVKVKDVLVGESLTTSVANNWRWFASAGALLLLTGAAWSSRSKWVRFARKLRSR
jgi:hypothetical protein